MSPSYQHSYICGSLISLFRKFEQYSVFSELTLNIGGNDYVPDVCLYGKRKIDFTDEDIVKMTEMPLLIAGVLSPSQTSQEIISKFKTYFEAGVKSCWLVIPIATSVVVYSSPKQARIFKTGEIADSATDIRVAVEEIFV